MTDVIQETEREVKLEISDEEREQLLASSSGAKDEIETIYYDTHDFCLAEMGWTLRLRREFLSTYTVELKRTVGFREGQREALETRKTYKRAPFHLMPWRDKTWFYTTGFPEEIADLLYEYDIEVVDVVGLIQMVRRPFRTSSGAEAVIDTCFGSTKPIPLMIHPAEFSFNEVEYEGDDPQRFISDLEVMLDELRLSKLSKYQRLCEFIREQS